MTFNFCDPAFLPRINTSAISVDGFDVSNLAKSHNKGFIVESFMKPPVSVTIDFPVNISISKVVVAAFVGSQRTSGLEVYSHSQRRNSTWLFDSSGEGASSPQTPACKDVISDDKQKIYTCIGRAMDSQAKYFAFCNPQFRLQECYRNIPDMEKHSLPPEPETAVKQVDLRAKNHHNLMNVSTIVLRITRASYGSTCAIKWVEVWGTPSWSCPRTWVEHIMSRFRSSVCEQTKLTHQEFISDKPVTSSCSSLEHSAAASESELPEEFLDPLTQEMLTSPVLLPCGKSINQSSLDKHICEQAKWGQPPTDPFTGQPFTSFSKPVPNALLKTRLDRYLFQHPQLAGLQDSRLGRSAVEIPQPMTTKSNLVHMEEQPNPRTKRTADEQLDTQRPSKIHKHNIGDLSRNGKSSSFSNVTHPSVGMSADLDVALKDVLAGLPSFIQKDNSEVAGPSSGRPQNHCIQCKSTVDIKELYQVGCGHVICRKCLLNLKQLQTKQKQSGLWCPECKTLHDVNNVVKAHR